MSFKNKLYAIGLAGFLTFSSSCFIVKEFADLFVKQFKRSKGCEQLFGEEACKTENSGGAPYFCVEWYFTTDDGQKHYFSDYSSCKWYLEMLKMGRTQPPNIIVYEENGVDKTAIIPGNPLLPLEEKCECFDWELIGPQDPRYRYYEEQNLMWKSNY